MLFSRALNETTTLVVDSVELDPGEMEVEVAGMAIIIDVTYRCSICGYKNDLGFSVMAVPHRQN